ncbi:hypothetical protein AYL99_01491 [Fonsecaea erecta]|uniref:F-box domain-containing protein n=1 Tax=Fonsecaea erecta TaxID=1367422 RepID=A0A179A0G5_9EURO|nr:hypothetical protein AYL99_01491 [Fonsecaea erecta]OAP65519.1 hypothetical protein AYL99_01491 [Fonsecaea erecta]
MPKVTASEPKGLSRSLPYPKKQPAKGIASSQSNKSAAEEEKQKDDPPGFRFLDLPSEIRLHIYDYFAVEDTSAPADDESVKQTRKSLQTVCRQISNEWTPIFFSTTTIVVDSSNCTERWGSKTDVGAIGTGTMTDNLKYITKLKYIIAIHKRWYNSRIADELECFLKGLQERLPRLPSLAEVTFWVGFDEETIPLRATYHLRREADRKMEQLVSHSTGSGFLNGWKAETGTLLDENHFPAEMQFIFRREQPRIAKAVEE